MKNFILLFLVLFTIPSISIFSQGKGKPVIQTLSTQAKDSPEKTAAYTGIKAVLVVGPVEEMTSDAIARVKAIASFLNKKGVSVIEIFDPEATWERITSACEGAHIFLYSGHGANMGFDSRPGGLCLSHGSMISAETVVKELHLHKNALVLFHTVCMGAGSSAGDDHEIDANVALQRVSDYALAFVRLGAGGYYANNYSGSMVAFLESFFEKKTMKEIYVKEANRYGTIELMKKYPYDTSYQVSVAASKYTSGTVTRTTWINGKSKTEEVPSFKSFDVAFVGRQGFTIETMLK